MNDNVVPFKPKTVVPKPDPHITGQAHCLNCTHKWIAVAPTGTFCLQCPSCLTNKGHYVHFIDVEGDRWQCGCGCQLFFATGEGFYCPNCGVKQSGF